MSSVPPCAPCEVFYSYVSAYSARHPIICILLKICIVMWYNDRMNNKDKLKQLLQIIPEKGMDARKVYNGIQLMDTIRQVCITRHDCNSYYDFINNLVAVGKRLNYIRHEYGEDECNKIIQDSINFILGEYGDDKEWIEGAIKNIERTFEEQEHYSRKYRLSIND